MNYQKFFARFYKEHPEMIADDKWKPKLICILRNYYHAYLKGYDASVEGFLDVLERIPVDFETLRREDQQYRSDHSCELKVKKELKLWK